MKLFILFLPTCIFAAILTAVFFYKTILFGQIPFPGDVLLSDYKPWQTYSYAGYSPGSIPNKAQYPDTLRQLYPWRTLATQIFKSGKIPLWNPYNFSGTPLLANFQSAVFYPFNFLYLLFPIPIAWTMLIMLQSFLALIFTYEYIRILGGSKLAAWFGAITYSFSLFSTVWLQYNTIGQIMIWLPLALLSIELMVKNKKSLGFLSLLISEICTLLAGHPQLAIYSFVFTLFYAWFRGKKVFKFVTVSTILSAGISTVQLIPGLELLANSARSPHEFASIFQKILIQPQQFLMTVVPNIFGNPATRTYWPADTFVGKATYVGIIPLFFLLAAFRMKNIHIKFFSIAAIAILILMSANPVTYVLYRINIPVFSSSSPTLMGFLFAFCLSVITSLGIDSWSKETHSLGKLAHRALTVIGFFVILWIIFKFSPHAVIAQKAILYSFGLGAATLLLFFIAITRRRLMLPALCILLLIQMADLFIQFQKFNPFVPVSYIFPQIPIFTFLKNQAGINRFLGYGSAAVEANFATQYQLFSPDGYDPLYPKQYGELIQSSYNGKIATAFTTQTRSDASVAPGYGTTGFISDPFRIRILNALGVKYILDRTENNSTDQTFPTGQFKQIYNEDGWKILENLQASPRIILASSFEIYKNNAEFEKLFFDPAFNPSNTVLLEENPPKNIKKPFVEDKVSLMQYEPNEILINTKSDGPRMLFLSDTYYPGWKAFIDNKETKIYKADYAFRAIYVPEGNHRVRFFYFPDSFRLGVLISSVSIILAFVTLSVLSLKHEKT